MNKKDLKEEITFLLRKIVQNVHAKGRHVLIKRDITFSQYYVLSMLSNGREYAMSSIEKELAVTKPGATTIANTLVRDGLAKRKRATTDRRIVFISITKKGKELLKSVNTERERIIKLVLGEIKTKEKNLLVEALRILFIKLTAIKVKK